MTVVFALMLVFMVAAIFMVGSALWAWDKAVKASVRPLFLVKRQLMWQFS